MIRNKIVRYSAAVCGAILMCGAAGCSGGKEGGEGSASGDLSKQLPVTDPASLTTFADSLAYYTGAFYGMQFDITFDEAAADGSLPYTVDRREFLRGIRDVIMADTVPWGFHDGVREGVMMADNFNRMHCARVDIDRERFCEAFARAMAAGSVSADSIEAARQRYQALLSGASENMLTYYRAERRRMARRLNEQAEANEAEGKAFIENIKADSAFTATSSGLFYSEVAAGSGATARKGQTAVVEYVIYLPDGTEVMRTDVPQELVVGRVPLAGLDEALRMMRPGSEYRLVLTPSLAYADRRKAPPSIGPERTIIMDVKLVEIK